jgi:hypothetical protein
MKRILLALTLVGLLLPVTPPAQGQTEVSLNFFYDNLSPYGSWLEVSDYGYVFQPSVAVDNSNWRPYADGYWAYTDLGWTWVSYEDFGWATYHYGRWTELADYGWVWVPGYEWGPAWVSWRTGGDYIGWAPLPPAVPRVYEGRVISGQIDLQFDIGPLYYNFVDIRYIGEPVLRERIIEPQRNITIINRTVNVTNITYNNSVVYNHGPDFNRVNEFSTRPVQRLSIEREATVSADLQNKRGNFNRVNGNQLVVVAPRVQKSEQRIAPKQVKARVEKPRVEHGWQGVQDRQQIQEAMKKENAKNVPPPSFKPERTGRGQATAGEQKPGQTDATAESSRARADKPQSQRAARGADRARNAEQVGQAGNEQEASERQTEQAARQKKEQQAQQRQAEREQRRNAREQANQPERSGNAQTRRAEPAEGENVDRPQATRRAERQQPRARQNEQANRTTLPERSRAQAPESRENERTQSYPQRRQQDQGEQQRLTRGQRTERAQQRQPAQEREQQPQRSREQMTNRGQQTEPRRERARPAPQAQQAQPRREQGQGQGQGEQNNQRKGKKKRPNETPPPQP